MNHTSGHDHSRLKIVFRRNESWHIYEVVLSMSFTRILSFKGLNGTAAIFRRRALTPFCGLLTSQSVKSFTVTSFLKYFLFGAGGGGGEDNRDGKRGGGKGCIRFQILREVCPRACSHLLGILPVRLTGYDFMRYLLTETRSGFFLFFFFKE